MMSSFWIVFSNHPFSKVIFNKNLGKVFLMLWIFMENRLVLLILENINAFERKRLSFKNLTFHTNLQ